MKNTLFHIFLCTWCLLLVQKGLSQNLVLNPSFEQIDSCPHYPEVLGYQEGAIPTGWWRWSNTPDYFNACATDTISDVPANLFGYQATYNGQAYSGFSAYYDNEESFREMIGTQLTAPVVPGVTYYASMRVSPGYGGYYDLGTFSNRMGMLFTMDSYEGGPDHPSYPLRNYSQVWQPSIVSDTTNWTLVSGSFVADSAYQYLVIGNHFNNENTNTLWSGTGSVSFTYYYVDQVCVSTDPGGCEHAIGIGEISNPISFVAPNPSSSHLQVMVNDPAVCRVELFDTMGSMISSAPWSIGEKVDVTSPFERCIHIELVGPLWCGASKSAICEGLSSRFSRVR